MVGVSCDYGVHIRSEYIALRIETGVIVLSNTGLQMVNLALNWTITTTTFMGEVCFSRRLAVTFANGRLYAQSTMLSVRMCSSAWPNFNIIILYCVDIRFIMPTGYVYIGVMYVYLLIPLLVLSHAILLYACMQANKQLSAYIVSRLFPCDTDIDCTHYVIDNIAESMLMFIP